MDNCFCIIPEAVTFLEHQQSVMQLKDAESSLRSCRDYVRSLPESDIRSDLETVLDLAVEGLITALDDNGIDLNEILEL